MYDYKRFCILGHSMSDGPKFQRLGHDLSQILMKLFQIKGLYEARLSSAQTDNPFKIYDTSKLTW